MILSQPLSHLVYLTSSPPLILHSQTPLQANLANIGKIDGIDRKKKSLHALTRGNIENQAI